MVSCSNASSDVSTTYEVMSGYSDIEVFFSNPTKITGEAYTYGPEMEMIRAIESARISIDMAIYSINLWDMRDALLDANDRGVLVRIITDSDNLSDDVIQELLDGGIKVLGDSKESLMHNKFIVIDRQDVWTGSMNYTVGSAYYDNNNLVHIHSIKLAMDYVSEFNEMFEMDMFGDDIMPFTPEPMVIVGGKLVEVYFSPDDGVSQIIVAQINRAQNSIVLLAYTLTSDKIGNAILDRFQEGITIVGIMDSGQAKGNQGSEFESFQKAGINLYLDESPGLMHHKVIIIDNQIVITGSYNFSNNAEYENDENILIIHDPKIADLFYDEYLNLLSIIEKK